MKGIVGPEKYADAWLSGSLEEIAVENRWITVTRPMGIGLEWAEARLEITSASRWPWLGDSLGIEPKA